MKTNKAAKMIKTIIKAVRVFKWNVPNYTVDAGIEEFGTCFHSRILEFRKAAYIDGWNRTDSGWVWFKHVGCHGYQHIKVGALERIAVSLAAAWEVIFGKKRVFCDPYWDYNDNDRKIIDAALNTGRDEMHATSVRNARLVSENRFKFLVKLVGL